MRTKDNRLHFSELKRIGPMSPKHYKHFSDNPPEDTRSFRMGRMAHRAWLLEDIKTIPVWHGRRDERNPDYAAALEANGGETLLNADEYANVMGMYDALCKHRKAMELRSRCTEFEKYVTWELLGVPMAGTLDAVGPGIVIDPKSCEPGKIHPRAFQRQGRRYGYPEQLALYAIGSKQAVKIRDWEWPECYNIAVENAKPHDVVVHRASPLLLDCAIRNAMEWVERWKQCKASNTWPGYADDIVDWNIDPDEITGTEDD